MPNRLVHESSPYLRQHAENPVDWYPWGEEAIAKARSEDKPIFLSIGYSACHWCHVMERESFENAEIARFLNDHFVCIKVDREEHPALDSLYMDAVQVITGRGGWPMSVFLTPDLEPFYGGTYWPPQARGGMPGFLQVIKRVAETWREHRDEAVEQGGKLSALLQDLAAAAVVAPNAADARALDQAVDSLRRAYDPRWGGFAPAPKFPHPMHLQLLLRQWYRSGDEQCLAMARRTLDAMADGGMYDQLGGGFHRYSTDERWLVPHFEKMLYDNALLAGCYLEAWQATGTPRYREVIVETLEYLQRDMLGPEGGFYAAEDADSEGVEGRFYVWTKAEIEKLLPAEQAKAVCCAFGVTAAGNFEGANILYRAQSAANAALELGITEDALRAMLDESRAVLRGARAKRVRPARDEKVLLGWNALAVESFARAGVVLERADFTQAARRAAEFLLAAFRDDRGRLLHSWCRGQARHEAPLEDYASFASALVTLYETSGEGRYLEEARRLVDEILARFRDEQSGAFFMTGDDHPHLLLRKLDLLDSPTPSGTGMTICTLLRLAALSAEHRYREAADGALRAALGWIRQAPMGTAQALLGLQMILGPFYQRVFVLPDGQPGGDASALPGAFWQPYIPLGVVAARRERDHIDDAPASVLFRDRPAQEGLPTLYFCEGFTCQAPAVGSDAIVERLRSVSRLAP